jgi:hypothetical protein
MDSLVSVEFWIENMEKIDFKVNEEDKNDIVKRTYQFALAKSQNYKSPVVI